MKRPAIYLLICMILIATAFPYTVLADGPDVSMKITASPAALSGEGDVTFTFSVTNGGDVPLRDLEVLLPSVWGTFEITDPWGSDGKDPILFPGETVTRELTHAVSRSELGTKLPFVLNGYTVSLSSDATAVLDNGRVQVVAYLTVDKASPAPAPASPSEPERPQPDVAGSVSYSHTVAAVGSSVDAYITVRNTGNVPVENVRVYLSKASGSDPVNNPFTLDIGQSKRICAELILEKDVTVTPSIRCDFEGNTYIETFGSSRLHAADPGISIVATADSTTPPVGGSVGVTVTVVNSGTEQLTDILITDYMGNLLVTRQNWLDAGKSLAVEVTERFSVPTGLFYSVTAVSGSGYMDAVSDVIEIVPVFDADSVKLELVADAEPAALDEPGSVTFSVTVTNGGDCELSSVSVSSDILGDIGTLERLSPGQKHTFSASAEVTLATSVSFTAAAQDAAGGSHTAAASAAVAFSSPAPSPDTPAVSEGIPALWLITGAAVLVVIIVLIVLSVTRARKK